jgi:hypothetical protein
VLSSRGSSVAGTITGGATSARKFNTRNLGDPKQLPVYFKVGKLMRFSAKTGLMFGKSDEIIVLRK